MACYRNCPHIIGVLKEYIPYEFEGICLGIASGNGYHDSEIAKTWRNLTVIPSDTDLPSLEASLNSIHVNNIEGSLSNIKPAIRIDVTDNFEKWAITENSLDLVHCINMIHISHWKCTLGMFSGGSKGLKKRRNAHNLRTL
eukprot:GHVL01032584.1.p1 GENE.GHVL01032584.1~~GHVL01032584.1.p1  ORF type:complete len:152 (+),score=13.15 GHVL01032584.1:34-456(+)